MSTSLRERLALNKVKDKPAYDSNPSSDENENYEDDFEEVNGADVSPAQHQINVGQNVISEPALISNPGSMDASPTISQRGYPKGSVSQMILNQQAAKPLSSRNESVRTRNIESNNQLQSLTINNKLPTLQKIHHSRQPPSVGSHHSLSKRSLATLQSMRQAPDHSMNSQHSYSLKKLSLNSPSQKSDSKVLKKIKVVQSMKQLEKPVRQQQIEDQNTVSKLTIQNDLLRNRLKVLSSQMDKIISQETASRDHIKAKSISASPTKLPLRQSHENSHAILDTQIEKANNYNETLSRQMNKLKSRLDQLEENPTYQTELVQSLNQVNHKIEQHRQQIRERNVRQSMHSIDILKQTKHDENQTADYVLKLKDKHDEYQVVIHNLTNAENFDQKTQQQVSNLNSKIIQLKTQLADQLGKHPDIELPTSRRLLQNQHGHTGSHGMLPNVRNKEAAAVDSSTFKRNRQSYAKIGTPNVLIELEPNNSDNRLLLFSPGSQKLLPKSRQRSINNPKFNEAAMLAASCDDGIVSQKDMDRLERQIAITKRGIDTVKQTYALRQRRYAEDVRKLKAEVNFTKEQLNIKEQNQL